MLLFGTAATLVAINPDIYEDFILNRIIPDIAKKSEWQMSKKIIWIQDNNAQALNLIQRSYNYNTRKEGLIWYYR
jgi:hypothetical protein